MKILKLLTGGIGSTTKSLSNTLKVVDDFIEKEHITGTIDKAKEFTGDMAQKAGEILEKGKMKVEEIKEQESYKPIGNMIEDIREKTKDWGDNLSDKIDDIQNYMNDEEE